VSLHATWASFKAAQMLFSPSVGNGMVLLAAVSVQKTPPCRSRVFRHCINRMAFAINYVEPSSLKLFHYCK
jgi:hypothetical protein